MRKAETTPKRLLLLPLIPALAFGLLAYVDHVSTGTTGTRIVVVEPTPAPVAPIVIDEAPEITQDPGCPSCAMQL